MESFGVLQFLGGVLLERKCLDRYEKRERERERERERDQRKNVRQGSFRIFSKKVRGKKWNPEENHTEKYSSY